MKWNNVYPWNCFHLHWSGCFCFCQSFCHLWESPSFTGAATKKWISIYHNLFHPTCGGSFPVQVLQSPYPVLSNTIKLILPARWKNVCSTQAIKSSNKVREKISENINNYRKTSTTCWHMSLLKLSPSLSFSIRHATSNFAITMSYL